MNILQLFAGTGIFLFAMYLLEESLKNLSGRNFKMLLHRMAKTRIGAVSAGALVTGILQSSSVVSLMVLAFVGAGIFSMKNALGIILGANLGTTLTNWLVATIGFKVNMNLVAFPALCLGGLLLIAFTNRKLVRYSSFFLLGFGLLFMGIDLMKSAMETQVKSFDLAPFMHMPLPLYLLIGFGTTLLVQSSSVTIALTLSALHAGAIEFTPAAVLVLGSETGTIIKIMISAIGGNAAKKRVALGNFLFNIILTVLAFIFLKYILLFITDNLGIRDPLIGLVTFTSLINFLGILLLLPFLNPFAKLLEKFFKDADASASAFINHANVSEPETALDLFKKETSYFIHNSMLYNLQLFDIDTREMEEHTEFKDANSRKKFNALNSEEKYQFLKQLQGELQSFYMEFRSHVQYEEQSQLNQWISAIRSTMHSVKSMKDIESNIANLRRSSKDIKYNFFLHYRNLINELYTQLNQFLDQKNALNFDQFQTLYDRILNSYVSELNDFYKEAQAFPLIDLDITEIINFNREVFTSNKAILMAVKDFLLREKEARDFNEILVYTT